MASLQPLVAMVDQATSAAVLCFCEEVLEHDGTAVRPLTLPAALHASLDQALGLTARYQLLLLEREAQALAAAVRSGGVKAGGGCAAGATTAPQAAAARVQGSAGGRGAGRRNELWRSLQGGAAARAGGRDEVAQGWQAYGGTLQGAVPPVSSGEGP